MTILGISISTSRIGVCILKDEELLDRQVHNYPTLWSDNKLHTIINRLRHYLQKYPVDAIVVKVPPSNRHTKPLLRLIKKVERLSAEHKCELDYMTKVEIKGCYNLHSTEEIIDFTRRLYPELQALYRKGEKKNHSFYKKLYEAVISAHIYNDRMQ
jgi:RNase H-fold protein (predicted Holliday junction resolvase)